MKLKVGQELWWVPWPLSANACAVSVIIIGYKWAYLSNDEKIDIFTLIADFTGWNCPGRCYPTKDDYDLCVKINIALEKLNDTHEPAEGVTLSDIEQARKLLRL